MFNKRPHWEILNKGNLELLFNQATNAVIKWLKLESRGKAAMGGYTEK